MSLTVALIRIASCSMLWGRGDATGRDGGIVWGGMEEGGGGYTMRRRTEWGRVYYEVGRSGGGGRYTMVRDGGGGGCYGEGFERGYTMGRRTEWGRGILWGGRILWRRDAIGRDGGGGIQRQDTIGRGWGIYREVLTSICFLVLDYLYLFVSC